MYVVPNGGSDVWLEHRWVFTRLCQLLTVWVLLVANQVTCGVTKEAESITFPSSNIPVFTNSKANMTFLD